MKSFFSHSILALALCTAATTAYAVREYERDSYRDECSSCFSWLWENIGFEVKGGVVPIIWTERGNPLCNDCTNITSVETNRFLHVFKVPWTVGAELQWSTNECNRVYLDFQYRQAKGKDTCLTIPVFFSPGSVTETLRFNKYQTYSLYFGGDHFFFNDWLCDNVSAFVGIKVGFTHQRTLNLNIFPTGYCDIVTENCFRKRNVFSGGGRFGLEYGNLCNCLAVNLTVEILGQAGPRFGTIVAPSTSLATDVVLSSVASEVLFPVTLGLRYNF